MRIDDFLTTERFYLTDGGLETYMIFDEGFDLPCFSAAALLDTERGRKALTSYYRRFIDIAAKSGRGYVIDAPTWRAGLAWAEALGLSDEQVMELNCTATAFVRAIRDQHEAPSLPIILNGLIGPAGDAYAPDYELTAEESFQTHAPQINALAEAGIEMISAMTLIHPSEAIGMVRAANRIGVPIAVAFTLETDGCLPSGQTLASAIAEVDAATDQGAAYFMINCAHPDHFASVLDQGAEWLARIGGLRTNASRLSHAELDEAEELDSGDPEELSELHLPLLACLPQVRVIGGCCGTDHRHVGQLAGLNEASFGDGIGRTRSACGCCH